MTTPDFDTIIDRRGTHSSKWDMMETLFGVSPEDGLSMWVADMDFNPPQSVLDALQGMVDHGVFGYYGDDSDYRNAIAWWMKNRHGWDLDPNHIFTTQGLVQAVALCLQAYSDPGDGVVLFTPVYHAFARTIRAAGREVVECQLDTSSGVAQFDFEAYDAQMTGNEKILILCSPHNPGGRVWTKDELIAVADFAKKHDLLLISDEVHHDLTFGAQHTPMPHIDGVSDRLIMLTAPSKTFNIAGTYCGQVTIADQALRKKFGAAMAANAIGANSFGLVATMAAYSPEGAEWVDALIAYIAENKRVFDEGVNAIPGLKSVPLQGTYLAWVDFSGTGMTDDEIQKRITKTAKIAANLGPSFGKGGTQHMRFNLGTQRARINDAVARLTHAFGDLQ